MVVSVGIDVSKDKRLLRSQFGRKCWQMFTVSHGRVSLPVAEDSGLRKHAG